MPKLVAINKKEEKQLAKKEAKALIAARVEPHLKKTLLGRQHKMSLDIDDEEIQKLADEMSDNDELEIEDEENSDDFEAYAADDTDEETESEEESEEDEDERDAPARK